MRENRCEKKTYNIQEGNNCRKVRNEQISFRQPLPLAQTQESPNLNFLNQAAVDNIVIDF
jgi:hypothetical protein